MYDKIEVTLYDNEMSLHFYNIVLFLTSGCLYNWYIDWGTVR